MRDSEYIAYKSRRRPESRRIYKSVDKLYKETLTTRSFTKDVEGFPWRAMSTAKKIRFGERLHDSVGFNTEYSMNKHNRWERVTPETLLADCDTEKANFCVVNEYLNTSCWGSGKSSGSAVHWLNPDTTTTTTKGKSAHSKTLHLVANASGMKPRTMKEIPHWTRENKETPLDENGKLRITYTIYEPHPDAHIYNRYHIGGSHYGGWKRECLAPSVYKIKPEELAFDPHCEDSSMDGCNSACDNDDITSEYKHTELKADLLEFLRPATARRRRKSTNVTMPKNVDHDTSEEDFELIGLDDCQCLSSASSSTSFDNATVEPEFRNNDKIVFVDRRWLPSKNITGNRDRYRTRPQLFDPKMNTELHSLMGKAVDEPTDNSVPCPRCSSVLDFPEKHTHLDRVRPDSFNMNCPKCHIHFCPQCIKEPHFPMNCEEFEKWTEKFDIQYALSTNKIEASLRRITCPCGSVFEAGDVIKTVVCPGCRRRYDPTDKLRFRHRTAVFNEGHRFRKWRVSLKPKFRMKDVHIENIDLKPRIAREFAEMAVCARKMREDFCRGGYLKQEFAALRLDRQWRLAEADRIKMILLLIEHGSGWLYMNRHAENKNWTQVRKTIGEGLKFIDNLLSNFAALDLCVVYSTFWEMTDYIATMVTVLQKIYQ